MAQPYRAKPQSQSSSSSPPESDPSSDGLLEMNSDALPLLIQHRTGAFNTGAFTPPTTGHAFVLIKPYSIVDIYTLANIAIQALRNTDDPNNGDMVPGFAVDPFFIVHWGVPPHPSGGMVFPSTTRLTNDNLEAVLNFMRRRRGYDFLEIGYIVLTRPPIGREPGPPASDLPIPKFFRKSEQEDQGKGAGRGSKGPPQLDYRS